MAHFGIFAQIFVGSYFGKATVQDTDFQKSRTQLILIMQKIMGFIEFFG